MPSRSSPRGSDDRDYVNSLARGLMVIRAFNRSRPSMTLSEVAKRTGINRAAARRLLLTLVREGYVETDGKYFRATEDPRARLLRALSVPIRDRSDWTIAALNVCCPSPRVSLNTT